MEYSVKVFVKQVPKEELFDRYVKADVFAEACKQCPFYGTMWSCPPGVPSVEEYMKEQNTAFLVGVKVSYSDALRSQGTTPEKVQEIRDHSYEKIKRNLLLTLLELEKEFPGGICIGAGRCILCSHCARQDGESCRYPKLRRYSITAFGFDFARMVRDLLGIELLWSPDGLPEYDVAVSGLFYT